MEYLKTPLGWLKFNCTDHSLKSISFQDPSDSTTASTFSEYGQKVRQQLQEYFKGTRTKFNLNLAPEGTSFQKEVWQQLENIPFGQTISYRELARQIGDPNKMRAVGRANGQNPIPIIIPCHRVIGSNGQLTGYSGGIYRKKWLLRHEGALLL
jgi:methylated-DNA-[protein]-cysteine S-methyltransferase